MAVNDGSVIRVNPNHLVEAGSQDIRGLLNGVRQTVEYLRGEMNPMLSSSEGESAVAALAELSKMHEEINTYEEAIARLGKATTNAGLDQHAQEVRRAALFNA